MNSPQDVQEQAKRKANLPQLKGAGSVAEPCACCAIFFSDYSIQKMEEHWDNPRQLHYLINELLDEGFGHLAKPILWRWHKLVPDSPDYTKLLIRISDQIWLCGSSKTIHDQEKSISESDIERGVKHDMALLELRWARNAEREKKGKKGRQSKLPNRSGPSTHN